MQAAANVPSRRSPHFGAPPIGAAECMAVRRYVSRHWPGIDADDVTQDVALAYCAAGERFDHDRPLIPYLLTIARRRVMDRFREMYRAEARMRRMAQDSSARACDDEVIARVDVDRLLAGVTKRQRAAIEATRLMGMSTIEASNSCGQSESLVRVNVHRGIKRMRELI